MKYNKILVSGQAAAGKDETVNFLLTKFPDFVKVSLATPVKKIYCEAFDVDLDFIEKWKRIDSPPPEFNQPVRETLQFIGDGFRAAKENIWLNKLFLKYQDKNIACADGRYILEAETFKLNKNSFNIVVWRPGHENNSQNRSEREIKEKVVDILIAAKQCGRINHSGLPEHLSFYDYFIINDGSVKDLHNKLTAEMLPFFQ